MTQNLMKPEGNHRPLAWVLEQGAKVTTRYTGNIVKSKLIKSQRMPCWKVPKLGVFFAMDETSISRSTEKSWVPRPHWWITGHNNRTALFFVRVFLRAVYAWLFSWRFLLGIVSAQRSCSFLLFLLETWPWYVQLAMTFATRETFGTCCPVFHVLPTMFGMLGCLSLLLNVMILLSCVNCRCIFHFISLSTKFNQYLVSLFGCLIHWPNQWARMLWIAPADQPRPGSDWCSWWKLASNGQPCAELNGFRYSTPTPDFLSTDYISVTPQKIEKKSKDHLWTLRNPYSMRPEHKDLNSPCEFRGIQYTQVQLCDMSVRVCCCEGFECILWIMFSEVKSTQRPNEQTRPVFFLFLYKRIDIRFKKIRNSLKASKKQKIHTHTHTHTHLTRYVLWL